MKLLRELYQLTESEFTFHDDEAEEEWYDVEGKLPDVEGRYPDFPGLELLGGVTSYGGYRAGSEVAKLYRDAKSNVYEVDTLSGDGSENIARSTGRKVNELENFFA